MKLRAAILSMATVGLLAVPVFSFAQAADSASFPLSGLLPSLPLQAGAPAMPGIPSLALPSSADNPFSLGGALSSKPSQVPGMPSQALPSSAGNTLSPRMTLSGQPSAPAGTPLSTAKTLGGVTMSKQDSTKSIRAFGGGSGGTVAVGGGNAGFGGTATPEPGTVALLVGGVSSGLVALRRRRKKIEFTSPAVHNGSCEFRGSFFRFPCTVDRAYGISLVAQTCKSPRE